MKPRRTRWLLIGGASVLMLLLAGFLALRANAEWIVSKVLEQQLKVPVQIGALDLSVSGDTCSVTGLRLGQPDGFGAEPMVSVARIDIAGWRGAIFPDRHLKELRVNDLTVDVTTLADGRTNLSVWIESLTAKRKKTSDPVSPATPEEPANPFAMKVDRIEADGISIVRRDRSLGVPDFLLTIDRGTLEINDLIVGPYPDNSIGSLEIHCEIVQPEVEGARIAVASRFGPLATGIPVLLGAVRITGCLYETFVPAIPDNTDKLLGGEGFDLDVDFATSAGVIQVTGTVTTSNRSAYPFRVQGPIDAPVFELPEVLASVATRMTGGIGRLLNSTLTSGREVLVGAVGTATSMAKGAVHATGSLIKGAGQMATGLVSANREKSKAGFDSMTTGSGGHLAGGITGSVDAINQAGSRTSEALRTNPGFKKWVTESSTRHEGRTRALMEKLQGLPFPPRIALPKPRG
ncbi:MAG: hypothetical protein R3F07_01540 [Opitutaceae bacterium]